jgi:ATP adenylyltransferase
MDNLWAPWRMEYITRSREEGEEPCIFCTSLNQDSDQKNFLLYRGEKSFIILNKFPYNNGHIMVVPNQHTGDLNNLNQEEQVDLFTLIRLSTKALSKVMQPHGFNIGMNLGRVAGAGIEDHVHFHIVPRWDGDTNFMPVISNTKVVSEALEKSFSKLKRAIQLML